MSSSKYFEILSHPIRYSILKYLNIDIRSFSDIQAGINSNQEIVGSTAQLSFHLRKMQEEEIIIKSDNLYSASEVGIKLLNIIDQFENNESYYKGVVTNQHSSKKLQSSQINDEKKNDLPIIKRPDNLNHLISVFEYFEGKNYEYMEEKCFLQLPDCLTTDINPKEWITVFSQQIIPFLRDEKSKEWVIDRYLKLGYGTRGLQDYGLMDASLSVPPLASTFNTLVDLLMTRGKAGIYAETGMGKRRLSIYIASYWMRKFKTPILYLQNPHMLQKIEYQIFQDILNQNAIHYRKAPKWLVIIEDAHLVDQEQITNLKKLISGASNRTYSIFLSFTKLEVLKSPTNWEQVHHAQVEELYSELIPAEKANELDLHTQWMTLKQYFYEWIKWVAIDILFEYIPNPERIESKKLSHDSPSSFVVSLGFLKSALKLLNEDGITDKFSLILYHFLAQMYIMQNGKAISLKTLLKILDKYFSKELKEMYSEKWQEKVVSNLNNFSSPTKRLLPPFQHTKNTDSLTDDILIQFYHTEWGEEVCTILDSTDNQPLYDKLFINMFPVTF